MKSIHSSTFICSYNQLHIIQFNPKQTGVSNKTSFKTKEKMHMHILFISDWKCILQFLYDFNYLCKENDKRIRVNLTSQNESGFHLWNITAENLYKSLHFACLRK
jgi:hypothetical protein